MTRQHADPDGGFFWTVIRLRWPILLIGLLAIVGTGINLPKLVKDTTAGAFIDPGNPALLYREKVEELFGLRDPIVVAVVARGEDGIYTPGVLETVSWLTGRISAIEHVDPERVVSLATESNVVGTADGMEVEKFFDTPPGTPGRAAWIRDAIADFPLYQGNLVARDGTATMIVAELLDEDRAEPAYDAIEALTREAPVPPGTEIYIAGESAVAGYLSSYIDRDAARLNPMAGLIITLVLFAAFRTLRGALVPNLVVLATVAVTLGTMAATGIPFYIITNGLIVCLIGISIADSIHVFSTFYDLRRERPDLGKQDLIVQVMREKWRPILLTSLTTIAGFLALWPTNDMPPIRYFGLFGALGIAVALVYTLTFLPALMAILPLKPARPARGGAATPAARPVSRFGAAVLAHPGKVVLAWAIVAAVAALGATRVTVDEERIENLKSSDPLYIANETINDVMDGTYNLDIVVETPETEGLYDPAVLRRIEEMQRFLETQPHVNGTTSIVDYIKQMHRAVNENDPAAYTIPDDPNLVAQLFLLYQISGDPTDFEEEVDYDRRRALVRAYLDTGAFTNNRPVIENVQAYIDEHFSDGLATATATGRVNVDYHWIKGIAETHAASVVVSAFAVLAMAALLFRSVVAGIFCLLPVAMAILLIYGVMGFNGIWLAVGTSMFASIAIGLGVDFAIHVIDRLKVAAQERGRVDDETLADVFRTTGRALLYNFAAIVLGFGVLMTSDIPPLINFGMLVAVAVSAAFLASMTLLPAAAKLARPAFLARAAANGVPAAHTAGPRAATSGAAALVLAGGLALSLAALPGTAWAQDLPPGDEIMARVDARDEGEFVTRDLRIELTDRQGTTRTQEMKGFRRFFGEEKRTVLFYEEPTNVKGTAFLTYDYPEAAKDDDQWLYLPALRKVRRIPSSDRGDYFLGTDFTYEEIKKENKVELSDYAFETTGTDTVDGAECYVVEGTPSSEDVARELGYGRAVWCVDPEMWISRRSDYWDVNGNPLKTITNLAIEQVDGIWTVTKVRAENHKTGHSTVMTTLDADYRSPVPERMFEQHALRRGI